MKITFYPQGFRWNIFCGSKILGTYVLSLKHESKGKFEIFHSVCQRRGWTWGSILRGAPSRSQCFDSRLRKMNWSNEGGLILLGSGKSTKRWRPPKERLTIPYRKIKKCITFTVTSIMEAPCDMDHVTYWLPWVLFRVSSAQNWNRFDFHPRCSQ